jgi:mRNA interferase MazF
MGTFVKGDVVVIPFPYSDFSRIKRRPALILAVPRDDEVIVCQITGQKTRTEFTIPITDSDFIQGGLKQASFARANHIFMVESKIIKYCAGKLNPKTTLQVIETTIKILREK